MVIGACRAEVGERQIVEVEVAGAVDGELSVASARTGVGLPLLGRRRCHPLERLAAVLGVPDPARVRGEGAGDARVDAVRVRGIEPDVLLEADALDTADSGLPERGRSPAPGPVAVCVKHGRGQGQT